MLFFFYSIFFWKYLNYFKAFSKNLNLKYLTEFICLFSLSSECSAIMPGVARYFIFICYFSQLYLLSKSLIFNCVYSKNHTQRNVADCNVCSCTYQVRQQALIEGIVILQLILFLDLICILCYDVVSLNFLK